MASSRRWSPADAPSDPAVRVSDAVQRALAATLDDGATLVVALSGGRDSVALFDATIAAAAPRAMSVVAVHVHHGLSRNADQWSRFCASLCERHHVPYVERRVDVSRAARTSVEAEARRARYAALASAAENVDAAAILLAHQQDDQAETVLLQLLRGAGPRGLAAMPHARIDGDGRKWLRPLLDVPRAAIDAYVTARALAYIDDDTNSDTRYARNALRQRIVPALAQLASGYPATIARAAALQAEAARIADDLARIDSERFFDGATLARNALMSLPPYRARNLLRWFLAEHALAPPSAARLEAMHRQLATARGDAHVRIAHAGAEVGLHRDRVFVHKPAPPPFEVAWNGEPSVALPHGLLRFVCCDSEGISAARMRSSTVIIRSRRGGERIQLASNRPRQALKSLLQRACMPEWTRAGLPLIFFDDVLACVPRIGIDARFAARPGESAYRLVWTEQG